MWGAETSAASTTGPLPGHRFQVSSTTAPPRFQSMFVRKGGVLTGASAPAAPSFRICDVLAAATSASPPACEVMGITHATVAVADFAAATLALRTAFADATCAVARAELPEDEHERFMQQVESLLNRFGQVAFEVTERLTLLEGADPAIGLSALRAASQVHDPTVHETRLTFARNALHSKTPELRFGALNIFADLGDPVATTDLAAAAHREPISAIRADMQRIAARLAEHAKGRREKGAPPPCHGRAKTLVARKAPIVAGCRQSARGLSRRHQDDKE